MLSYASEAPDEAVAAFVQGQPMGRLITLDEAGFPRLGFFNFVFDGEAFDLHLPRHHPQLRDLEARPSCLFNVDELLAMVPSHWVDAENGGLATAYYRLANFRCQAQLSQDPAVLGPVLQRMLDREQPEGGYRALDAEDPLYRGAFRALVAVRLLVEGRSLKFKHAHNRPAAKRLEIAASLRGRGLPGDLKAAELLEGMA